MLLAGDIGGTNTRLALYDDARGELRLVRAAEYESRSSPTLEGIVQRFLDESGNPPISAACLGVAGAVVAGEVHATNLSWHVREETLRRELRIPRVRLLNDLEAAAHGVVAMSDPSAFMTLQRGEVQPHLRALALVAAGTGLGVAFMAWEGHQYRVTASEGGHCDFAPQDEVEDALLASLRAQFGHVSYERVVSGPGLVNVYRFLRTYRGIPEPEWLSARIERLGAAPAISAAALAHEDAVCDEALTKFVSVYGAAAGNYALSTLAVGGVFLGGGIAPKILPRLQDGPFLDAFAHKGRFADYMRRIPVHVVLAPDVALLGAAACVRSGG